MLFYNPYYTKRYPDNKSEKSPASGMRKGTRPLREEWHLQIRERRVSDFPIHEVTENRLKPADLVEKYLLWRKRNH